MTTKELNAAIRKLNTYIKGIRQAAEMMKDNTAYFRDIDKVAKPEFIRLLNADNSFKSLTAESIRILLRLNLSHRFVAFHTFGLYIEI